MDTRVPPARSGSGSPAGGDTAPAPAVIPRAPRVSALDASRRTTRDLIPIVIAALLLRLPIALSRAPLGFDDGVYFASAGALRAGGRPFAEVYSSQGPAFLPLLWLADQLGLRTWWSPRLLPLLAGVALTVLIYRLAQSLTDRAGAATSALLLATSGCLLYSTTRIESDGVALAFAAGAVLVASRSGAPRDVLTAALLGIAVAVKSLLVAPAALAVLWLVWRRRGWRPTALVVAGAAVVLSLLSVPWGLRAVWEQSILLHLQAADGFDVAANSRFVREVLRDRDRLLLGFGVAAIAWSVGLAIAGGRRSWRAVTVPSSERDLRVAMWIWMLGSVAVVLLHQPLFLQHLAIVVPPAALLIGLHRPPVAVIVAVAVQFCGIVMWAGSASARLDVVEIRAAGQVEIIEFMARVEAQLKAANRQLARFETKRDGGK